MRPLHNCLFSARSQICKTSVALRSGKYRLAQWSHPMNRNIQYDISNVQTVRIDVDLDNDNTL